MRIDGYDNVDIPTVISMSPAADTLGASENWREKLSNYLAGLGFSEMITNAITNSRYYSQDVLQDSVKLLNNLSAELDIMRPSMLETGLEVIRHNLNRKNGDLRLFEFGKTYHQQAAGQYAELPRLALYVTGDVQPAGWQAKAIGASVFYLKGVVQNLLAAINIDVKQLKQEVAAGSLVYHLGKRELFAIKQVDAATLAAFDIKQPVYYAEANWNTLLEAAAERKIEYTGLPRFPLVERDLAMVLDKATTYQQVEQAAQKARIGKLTGMRLFDVFESDKLGAGKKSMAVNFTFYDAEKTLTDKETDGFVQKLIQSFEQELQAEIRK
jgi:phenylalanyl-tRNA synthetase beta chain